MKLSKEQKQQIGTVLGIGLFGFATWYLFFKGKEKISITMPKLGKKTNASTSSGSGTSRPPSGGTGYTSSGGSGGSNHTPNYSTGFPMQKGSRGEKVKELQNALDKAGYSPGTIDGVWGNKTQVAYEMAFGAYSYPSIKDQEDLDWVLDQLS